MHSLLARSEVHPLAKHLRRFLLLTLLAVLGYLAWPWASSALYAVRLSTMAAPSVLDMPVAGVKPRDIRDTWHAARPPARRHEGIDIFARRGTPVLASTEGIVFKRELNRLGGNAVWLYGPGRQYHYYAHLDSYAGAGPGERVQAGALLGYVGNTGNAKTTPPHLHYGIYTVTGAINPYPLLAPAGGTRDAQR